MQYRVISKDIALVGAAVRRLGSDRTIVNEMTKEIRKAGPILRAVIKKNAISFLPKRGGLNEWVASSKVRIAVRRGARSAGVNAVVGRNSAKRRTDSKAIDRGRVRAPAWGRRTSWHTQVVTPGFASKAVEDEGATEFRRLVVEAVDRAVEKVI